ncbi:MAG: polysaccharide lyase beta-sandwich domain-containing protein [Cytophagales bacterium]|nr:polysaccharide lyase beta-sandwich domain-containing protein [Cytophagales bacterium]
MKNISLIIAGVLISYNINAQEILFADYFDINTNKESGSTVFGKVHLKRNKDVDKRKIPRDYQFEITDSDTNVFTIRTEFDRKGRIFGVLQVAPRKNTGLAPTSHKLTVALMQGKKTLVSKEITIHVVQKTVWEYFVDFYKPVTLSVARLHGKKIKNKELSLLIGDLEKNNGKFLFADIYDKHPSEYAKNELEKDWQSVASKIGGLGYAYAKSEKFGLPSGDPETIERLKRVLYKALVRYMSTIPIEPGDLTVDGKPTGTELGDGFSMLSEHGYASHGFVTHHWRVTDALGAALVHLWPAVLEDIAHGDEEALKLYDSAIRFFQLFFSIVPERRSMDNPLQRWKDISNKNYSEGAWSDANISHRMRTLMVMPIVWADYNRPITYVPYWYDDYYNGTEFEGMTFADKWSPSGVVLDLRHWCDKLSIPTHLYDQSGFHPDGTMSHHTGHQSSDVAMFAYGYEWLTTVNDAIGYFQNTAFPIEDKSYRFIADRLNYTYRRMLYKDYLDYTVAGRSFFSDLSNFGSRHVAKDIEELIDGKSPSTVIENEQELIELKNSLKKKAHSFTGTTSFWNADYLVHRKEDGGNKYFFSVKHKSVRTSGAEDFTKVRKSWHAGSGVFQLKVNGDEYSHEVMSNADWHTLPGVTEEWRTDEMPGGPASASLPGGNEFSGILSDGVYGLTGYHHKPIDKYTSAKALKSYHMVDRFGTALGSKIARKKKSKGTEPIVTCIDQSALSSVLSYRLNGKRKSIAPGESVNIAESLEGPSWVHHGSKGYLIFPVQNQQLFIKTGKEINVTATDLKIEKSANYILALDHGVTPDQEGAQGYHYVLVADVKVDDMPGLLDQYVADFTTHSAGSRYHALYSKKEELGQVVFYKPGRAKLKKQQWVETDHPAILMVKDLGKQLRISLVDPLHSLETAEIRIKVSEALRQGIYNYEFPGIKPREGEKVVVTSGGEGSVIAVSLPDKSDGKFYNYQEQMYAGAPIVITIEKE